MKKEAISKETKQEIEKMIEEFNNDELDLICDFYTYFAEYKGKYIYLKIRKYDTVFPAGRLTYEGDLNDLEFAIYKFSSQKYDPDEFMFPGQNYVDGTVMGALYACNTAYPPM